MNEANNDYGAVETGPTSKYTQSMSKFAQKQLSSHRSSVIRKNSNTDLMEKEKKLNYKSTSINHSPVGANNKVKLEPLNKALLAQNNLMGEELKNTEITVLNTLESDERLYEEDEEVKDEKGT